MNVRRLRHGELIAGLSGLLLLVFMFALKWYALKGVLALEKSVLGGPTSYNGWHGLTQVRWLLLVLAVAALAMAYFQIAQRAPAIPVTLAVIVTVLGLATVLVLIYRVLINPPAGNLDQRAGAYLGLVAALGILYGSIASLREEDGPDPAELDIETLRLPSHS